MQSTSALNLGGVPWGATLSNGTRLPRRFFRHSYTRIKLYWKSEAALQKGLDVAAKSLFGKSWKKRKDSVLIDYLFRDSAGRGATNSCLSIYLKEGNSLDEAKELIGVVTSFLSEILDLKNPKFAETRHSLASGLWKRLDWLNEEVAKHEKANKV